MCIDVYIYIINHKEWLLDFDATPTTTWIASCWSEFQTQALIDSNIQNGMLEKALRTIKSYSDHVYS